MTAPPAPPHRAPAPTAPSSSRARSQSGFTLIELLVVVAILGVLAGVTVFAVGELRDGSQEVACAADARAIASAQGAFAVEAGRPGTEAELVAAGHLAEQSEYHDVLVDADEYDLVPAGGCASADEPATLRTGLRIDDGTGAEPVPSRPRARVPCGVLGPDTGAANQNPVPCDDRRDPRSLRPDNRVWLCAPGQICDADIVTGARRGR